MQLLPSLLRHLAGKGIVPIFGACTEFCAERDNGAVEGDSPIFADTKIGTVPIFVPTGAGCSRLRRFQSRPLTRLLVIAAVFAKCSLAGAVHAADASDASLVPPAKTRWLTSYADAWRAAQGQNKMLLIYFCDAGVDCPCSRFKTQTLDDVQVRPKLRDYVCVELPLNAAITSDGKRVVLLEHEAFGEMSGQPGIAIVDFRSPKPPLRGAVVSTFPISEASCYTPEQMTVILDLPPGTLTQRTLIYAVRTHPEQPASANGQLLPALAEEAESHSQYQATIRLQGHHFWAARFPRIVSRLPGGRGAHEVVRRELARPERGGRGRRVRSFLAIVFRPLECRALGALLLRL